MIELTVYIHIYYIGYNETHGDITNFIWGYSEETMGISCGEILWDAYNRNITFCILYINRQTRQTHLG